MTPLASGRRIGPRVGRRLRSIYLLAAVLASILLGTIGAAIYYDQIAPFRRPVIEVDGRAVSMGYLLSRTLESGRSPLEMLDTLIREEILRSEAAGAPFNLDPTAAEVDRFLRSVASGSTPLTDEEFRQWYRNQLNESRLDESEFRDRAKLRLLARLMGEALVRDLDPDAEQVRLRLLAVRTAQEAVQARQRLAKGEDFARVVAEMSYDADLRRRGGDYGWVPREAMPDEMAQAVFALQPGVISEPFGRNEQQDFVVVSVLERNASRSVDEHARRLIGSRRLAERLDKAHSDHEIAVHGLTNGYDSATDAWVRWQLQKLSGS